MVSADVATASAAAAKGGRKRFVINSSHVYHSTMVKHWRQEEEKAYARQSYIPDRIAQMDAEMTARQIKQGDRIVERVKDIFYNGLGVQVLFCYLVIINLVLTVFLLVGLFASQSL